MRIINKATLGIALSSGIFFIGCTVANSGIGEESLGLRKTSLYTETPDTQGDKTVYSKTEAGKSKTFTRAFQDAPPMIPHSVDGMLPITVKNNQCISCHAPEVAPSLGAKPYPKSHMVDFRPKTGIASDGRISFNGVAYDNTSTADLKDVSIRSTGGRLAGARFNCSQCHAPQSMATEAPANNFEPVFTTKDGDKKSSWYDDKFMEGIDTTK